MYPKLLDKKLISFTPEYSDKNRHDISEIIALIKPIIKRILIKIVAYDNDNPVFSYYNDPNNIVDIATKVESDIASLREEETIDNDFSTLEKMLCHG